MKKISLTILITFILSFSAYAGTDGENTLSQAGDKPVKDCFEKVNRGIFAFNQALDGAIFEPVARGYRKLPSPMQSGISNFLSNLRMPLVIVNQLLQGQIKNSAESTGRFAVNTTAGVFGLFDVADKIGLEEKQEDYGQTLATWGVGDGFYVVLPIFGPSNLRDTAGLLLTVATDPLNAYAVREGEGWIVPIRTATNAVDKRSKIIEEVNAMRNNSVDYYAAVRSSYQQNRKAAILNIDDSELTPLPLISVEFE